MDYSILILITCIVGIVCLYAWLAYLYNQRQFAIIINHRLAFYILQWSWGILMNLIGAIPAIFILLFARRKPVRCGYCVVVPIKHDFGLSLGMFIFANPEYTAMLKHEHGHAFQNCLFGIFMPFVVGLPSAIRFWCRELISKFGNPMSLTEYDDIWFENQATLSGNQFLQK